MDIISPFFDNFRIVFETSTLLNRVRLLISTLVRGPLKHPSTFSSFGSIGLPLCVFLASQPSVRCTYDQENGGFGFSAPSRRRASQPKEDQLRRSARRDARTSQPGQGCPVWGGRRRREAQGT